MNRIDFQETGGIDPPEPIDEGDDGDGDGDGEGGFLGVGIGLAILLGCAALVVSCFNTALLLWIAAR